MKRSHNEYLRGLTINRPTKNGSALLMVMMLIFVTSMALGSLYVGSEQRVFALRRESHRVKALSIAEAGLGDAFRHIAEDISRASDSPIVSVSDFSGGEYTVTASTPTGANDGVVLLTSSGSYRGQNMESVATILIETETVTTSGETPTTPLGPFGPVALLAGLELIFTGGVQVNLGEYGAHANGKIVAQQGPRLTAGYLSTNGTVEMGGYPQITLDGGAGRLHANGQIDLYGSINASEITSGTVINGNWGVNTSAAHISPEVNYPRWYSNAPPTSIESVGAVEIMSLPFLDVEAYETYAKQHDYYFEGDQNIGRSWLTAQTMERTGENTYNNETLIVPEGGVMFVNGDITMGQDMDFEGVMIATGDVVLGGASTFSNPTDYPAIISVDGNIYIGAGASGLSVDGWIYAMNGSVTASGGASGMTGIIAAQNIEIKAGYSIGSSSSGNAVSWPGAGEGGGDGGTPSSGSVRLVSWIR